MVVWYNLFGISLFFGKDGDWSDSEKFKFFKKYWWRQLGTSPQSISDSKLKDS